MIETRIRESPDPGILLATALGAVAVCWLFGLEQFLPPLILMIGALWLLAVGRLEWPSEGTAFLVFLALTLGSLGALEGADELMLWARGSFNLVAGLVAFLVAFQIDPSSRGFAVFAKMSVVVLIAAGILGVGMVSGWLPLHFDAVGSSWFPERIQGSAFVRQELMQRRIGVELTWSLIAAWPRLSAFFLFQGGLGTAVLVLQPVIVSSSRSWDRRWRAAALAGVVSGIWCLILTSSRVTIALGVGSLAAMALWRALETVTWRRLAARGLVAAILVTALVAVIPFGGDALWERAFIDFRVKSFDDRADLVIESTEKLAERPWLGWGIQERPGESENYLRLGSHGELLNVGYRFGYAGLTAYLVLIAVLLGSMTRDLSRALGTEDRDGARRLVFLTVGVAAVVINGIVRDLQFDVTVYWLVWALAGVTRATGKRLTSP